MIYSSRLLSIFILGISFLTSLWSQEEAPDATAWLNPVEITSDKGVKAWFMRDPSTDIISLSFAFRNAGQVSDNDATPGRAIMAIQMMGTGAGRFSKQDFHKFLLDNGLSLTYAAGVEHATFAFSTLKDRKKKGLELLKAFLYKPRFLKEEWKLLQDQTRIHLTNLKHEPSHQGIRELFSKHFKGHPYACIEGMTEPSITQLRIKDLKTYKKNFLVKNRLVVGLIGNITEKEAKAFLDEAFGDLPQGKSISNDLPQTKPQQLGKVLHVKSTIPQSVVFFLQEGLSVQDKDFIALNILMEIMGGGLSSRLIKEIREKEGLVYGIHVDIHPLNAAPLIVGNFRTDASTLDKVVNLLRKQWKQLKDQGVTEQELDRAKNNMIGSYPLNFQTSRDIASTLLSYQLNNRPIDYAKKRREMIENITLKEINELATRIIQPDQLSFVVVGPQTLRE